MINLYMYILYFDSYRKFDKDIYAGSGENIILLLWYKKLVVRRWW